MNALESLALANKVRRQRADLKRHMKAGDVTLAWALRANKDYAQKMTLRELLIACPGLGATKVDRALKKFSIRPTARLYGVSMQRREELLIFLAQNYPRVKGLR